MQFLHDFHHEQRARDEQARAEGRDPDAPPPEGWSLARLVSSAADTMAKHPREVAAIAATAAAGYGVMRIRNELRQGLAHMQLEFCAMPSEV